MALFKDRSDAGQQLAASLKLLEIPDPVVLALPRGGVPIASEVARILGAPLDLIMVRKIGAPFQPELAVGAVVDTDVTGIIVNEEVARIAGLSHKQIEKLAEPEIAEIERRRKVYFGGRKAIPLKHKTAIIVDDGLATGTTALAAMRAFTSTKLTRSLLAVPVAPKETLAMLHEKGIEVVCLFTPDPFHAISLYYDDFHQLTDQEVLAHLSAANGDLPYP